MNEDIFHLGIKALIRDKIGQILLLKINPKKLIGIKKSYWDIPGGRIHRGSTVEQTLKREISEETGIKSITSIKPLAMVLSNIRIPMGDSDVGLILSIYDCENGDSNKIILSDEHIEVKWFSPKDASRLLKVKYPKMFTDLIKNLE